MNLFLNRAIRRSEAHRFAKKDETDVHDTHNDFRWYGAASLPE